MARDLTQKQSQVLEIIKQYQNEFDTSPTLQELQLALDISTKRGVVKHLIALENKGYIYRNGKARGIVLTDPKYSENTYGIPILGYANAGTPLVFADEDVIGSIQVDKDMIRNRKDVFALVVKGDSMNIKTVDRIPIDNGNYAIIQKGANVRNGDPVLAVINNAATIKSFKKSHNSIILYPESTNPAHTPIYIREDNDFYINGKVIAVLENPTFPKSNTRKPT
jgi:repressor LexA